MEIVRDLFRHFGRRMTGFRVGASLKRTSTATTVLAASASPARNVIIIVKVTETFANGTGAKPTFKIGQTGTLEKFAAAASFASGVAGDVLVFAGILSGSADFIITSVAATGTGTGSVSVEAIVLPSTA